MNLQNRATSLLNGTLVFANPLLLLTSSESLLPFLRSQGSLERRLLAVVTSPQAVPPARHLHFQVSKERTAQMRGGQWQCMEAWGYTLHPMTFQEVPLP